MAAKSVQIIEAQIVEVAKVEGTAKALVAQTAIDVLVRLHEDGQNALCNKLLLALSPANKKAVTQFYKEFSGYAIDKEEGMGKKKQPVRQSDGTITKDAYADARIAFLRFVDDGGNFWLWWAGQGKKDVAEAKPLDLNKLSDTVKKAAEKADKQGITKMALFHAIVTDVFSPDELLSMLDAMIEADKPVKAE